MQKHQVINLDLWTIRFPITAIASILHRVASVVLFLMIPLALYVLQESLTPSANFAQLMSPVWMKLLSWVFASALIYNFIAGARHFIMDFGVWETKMGGRVSSWITLIVSGVLMVGVGIHLFIIGF